MLLIVSINLQLRFGSGWLEQITGLFLSLLNPLLPLLILNLFLLFLQLLLQLFLLFQFLIQFLLLHLLLLRWTYVLLAQYHSPSLVVSQDFVLELSVQTIQEHIGFVVTVSLFSLQFLSLLHCLLELLLVLVLVYGVIPKLYFLGALLLQIIEVDLWLWFAPALILGWSSANVAHEK